jgi:F0F1-type ATP synthase gamma subunit
MQSLKDITINQKSTFDIKGLIEIYEEVAALKMQKVRKEVMDSQAYFDGLARLSDEVALDLEQYYQGKSKMAAVFLASETGMYGDLIDKVMVSYVNFVKSNDADAFIVGKYGVTLMNSYAPEVKFTEIVLAADNEKASVGDLSTLMTRLSDYSKICVFHGRFESIARQSSTNSMISGPDIQKYEGADKDNSKEGKKNRQERRFVNIYEPDVQTISEKFGKEISASVLDQSVKENQLAKYAARLMHLDDALYNVTKKLDTLDVDKKRMRKRIEQKKQIERIARWKRL